MTESEKYAHTLSQYNQPEQLQDSAIAPNTPAIDVT
jgi:hypothetical protein